VWRKTFAPGKQPFGEDFTKYLLAGAINFSLTAAAGVSTSFAAPI
jgi:hypothetical protein